MAITLGLAAFAASAPSPALADEAQELRMLEDQIRQLQAQIDALKKEQAQQAQQVQQAQPTPGGPQPGNQAAKAYVTGAAYMYGPYRVGGNEFGLSTADGQNTIELTGRLQFDAASYVSWQPQVGLTNPQKLESGVNGRRLRLGVVGQFAGDFQYGLVADFGGSSDSISPYASGAATSEIENAFISYAGFNKPENRVPAAFDVGYIDAPIQLNEAMSSNDRLMLEAPTPEVIATEFGGGDQRSVAGFRSYKSNYYVAAYVSGPAAGTPHNFSDTNSSTGSEVEVTSGEALAYLGRATYQAYTDSDGNNLHVGVNGAYMTNPGTSSTFSAGTNPTYSRSLTLSDRPELRVDPTAILTTGAMANVSHGAYIGGELAGQYDHFFAQGEFYEFYVNRYATAAAPLVPGLNFYGGYGEASWTVAGKRSYAPSTGAYTGVAPDHPLSLKEGGGWGAVEFAARYSYTDLNSHWLANTTGASQPGVEGGIQQTVSFGINYYPYSNVKLMLDYMHTNIDRESTAATSLPNGATIDAIAARFQVAW